MQWNELFGKEHQPSDDQIKDFVGTPLWEKLDVHLRQAYNVKPKMTHSSCAMDKGMWKGWNVKYKKSGKALCTVYPKQGYLLLLMPIGQSEVDEAQLLMPLCTQYTQSLFEQSPTHERFGKSLALEVRNEDVVRDVKNLIEVKMKAMAAKK